MRPGLLEIAGEDHQSVLQVVCGGMHTLALMEDGRVYSWGVNDEGALGRPTADKVWNELGEGAFAAMKDGFRGADLGILGTKSDPYVPGRVPMPRECEGKKVVQLSAGDSHSCALLDDGSVLSWGTFRDASGVMGFSATTRLQLVPAVVYTPGEDSTLSAADSHGRRPAVLSISSGADHVCALTGDGTVVSWGSGQQGQLGRVGERMSERMRLQTFLVPTVVPVKRTVGRMHRIVVDVACGTYSTFMLLSDGSVYACGLNNYGQLGIDSLGVVYAPTLVPGTRGVTKVFPGQVRPSLCLSVHRAAVEFGIGAVSDHSLTGIVAWRVCLACAAPHPLPDILCGEELPPLLWPAHVRPTRTKGCGRRLGQWLSEAQARGWVGGEEHHGRRRRSRCEWVL